MSDARVVVLGHVDHGKSTLIGRLLHDSGSLPAARIEEVVASSRRRGLQTEWSFALDALQDERDQAITIDTTRVWLTLGGRRFAIIDAPGHEEFLANAMTGASDADAAIFVIDAERGVEDQSRRHAYLLGLLSIPHVIVAVNKIDAVSDPGRILAAGEAARSVLEAVGVAVTAIVPVSARDGDNVVTRSERTPYDGPTLAELLGEIVPRAEAAQDDPFRMWVQDVYRRGDDRIAVGTLRSGRLRVGEMVRISPAGKSVRVAALRSWPADLESAVAGRTVGVVFDTPVYVDRGDLLSHDSDPPVTVRALEVRACWFDREPPHVDETLRLRAGSADVSARVVAIRRTIDPRTLEPAVHGVASRGMVYSLALRTAVPIALDEGEPCAIARRGWPIAAAHAERLQPQGANVFASAHLISATQRADRNAHRGLVLWLTGLPAAGKTTIAMHVERELFRRQYHVYALDGDTLRTGLNSDLDFSDEGRRENIRRVAEVGKLLADGGTIALISLVSPSAEDRAKARAIVGEAFREAYVAASVAVCEARDPKRLYRRARAGEIQGFTGVDGPYDVPAAPDLVLDTERNDVEHTVAAAVEFVVEAVRAFRSASNAGTHSGKEGLLMAARSTARKRTTTRKKSTGRKKTAARKKTTTRKKSTRKKATSTRKKSTGTRKKSTGARKKSTGARKKSAGRKKSASKRKYSRGASEDVREEMHEFKRGKLRSGPGGKGGKVKSRKQAIAIGLSEARASGKKVPSRKGGRKKKS